MEQPHAYIPYQLVEGESGKLRAALARYGRNWPWFVGSLAAALVAAYVCLLFQPPVYRIQAGLLIKDGKKGVDGENSLKEIELFGYKKVVENEIEILKSHTLMKSVVSRFDLGTRYYIPTRFGDRETFLPPVRLIAEKPASALYEKPLTLTFPGGGRVGIDDSVYPMNQSVQTPYGRLRVFSARPVPVGTGPVRVSVQSQADAVQGFARALKAEPTSKASSVIMLTIEDVLPERGEAILTQLIDEYNQAAIEDKNRMAANTLTFIDDRLGLIADELASVEKDVERYKSTQGITDLSAQAQGFLMTVQQNDAQLSQVKIQLGALADVDRYLGSQSATQGVAPATLGLGDPVLLGMVNRISELVMKREQLIRTTSELNPLVQTIDSQINETRANINDNVVTLKKQLLSSQQQLMINNRRMEGQIQTIPGKERVLLTISRQQAVKNDLYTYLLQKREETAVSFASTISDSRTVDAPRTDTRPVKPVGEFFFLLFAIAGLLLPVGVMAGRDALNDRVLRRSDVENQIRAPIVGELMKSRQAGDRLFGDSRQPVLTEQVRLLRTGVQLLCPDLSGGQTMLVTSSISGEGKSFVALNLGASLAASGRRTVLLDLDLRKNSLHQRLGLTAGSGLSDYLSGTADIGEVIRPVAGQANFYVISGGAVSANPSELLGTDRLTALIRTLKEQFDYVLLDSPPAGLFADARLMAPLADVTLFVVRHNLTPRLYVKQLANWYQEAHFNRLCIVLNAVGKGEAYFNHRHYGAYYNQIRPLRRLSLP